MLTLRRSVNKREEAATAGEMEKEQREKWNREKLQEN